MTVEIIFFFDEWAGNLLASIQCPWRTAIDDRTIAIDHHIIFDDRTRGFNVKGDETGIMVTNKETGAFVLIPFHMYKGMMKNDIEAKS